MAKWRIIYKTIRDNQRHEIVVKAKSWEHARNRAYMELYKIDHGAASLLGIQRI